MAELFAWARREFAAAVADVVWAGHRRSPLKSDGGTAVAQKPARAGGPQPPCPLQWRELEEPERALWRLFVSKSVGEYLRGETEAVPPRRPAYSAAAETGRRVTRTEAEMAAKLAEEERAESRRLEQVLRAHHPTEYVICCSLGFLS